MLALAPFKLPASARINLKVAVAIVDTTQCVHVDVPGQIGYATTVLILASNGHSTLAILQVDDHRHDLIWRGSI